MFSYEMELGMGNINACIVTLEMQQGIFFLAIFNLSDM